MTKKIVTMAKTYKVNEIFYSIQGEGRWAGHAAIFVRFSGCNLQCPFCDTDTQHNVEYTAKQLIKEIKAIAPECKFVVLTGGEPTLQVDNALTYALTYEGYYIVMETNGTRKIPANINWITCSPKYAYLKNAMPVITKAHEVKVVYDGVHEVCDYDIKARCFYVQPCDVGDKEKNADILKKAVEFVKLHSKWQLSLQQQKIINIK